MVNSNTLQSGALVGVVVGIAVFSIALLVLVTASAAVIIVMFARKLKKVKDRRRAVMITQYGICGMGSTEMLEVGCGERSRCGNQIVSV